jgi:hypothetical protein
VYHFNHTELSAVQPVGYAQQGRKGPHRPPLRGGQRLEVWVPGFRDLLAMAAGHQREHLDLRRLEAEQFAVADEVVGVVVMAAVVDRVPDVVQERCVLE